MYVQQGNEEVSSSATDAAHTESAEDNSQNLHLALQQLMKFTPYEVNYDNVGWHNVTYPKSTLYQNTTGSADNTIEREDSESTIEECDVDEECNAEEVYKEKRSSCQMYIYLYRKMQ